jgi:hypothetical protein
MNIEVNGLVIHQEYNGEFGATLGEIRCLECGDEVSIRPFSASKCRCGYEWSLETRAIGRKETPEVPGETPEQRMQRESYYRLYG